MAQDKKKHEVATQGTGAAQAAVFQGSVPLRGINRDPNELLERTDSIVSDGRAETMEQHIGRITHYFKHISVAVLEVSAGLKVGDEVHIQGHRTDFTQPVQSMEIEHQQVQSVGPGADIALKVIDHVRKGDLVYKVVEE
jgi:translation elongation factor EF-1alpha